MKSNCFDVFCKIIYFYIKILFLCRWNKSIFTWRKTYIYNIHLCCSKWQSSHVNAVTSTATTPIIRTVPVIHFVWATIAFDITIMASPAGQPWIWTIETAIIWRFYCNYIDTVMDLWLYLLSCSKRKPLWSYGSEVEID